MTSTYLKQNECTASCVSEYKESASWDASPYIAIEYEYALWVIVYKIT